MHYCYNKLQWNVSIYGISFLSNNIFRRYSIMAFCPQCGAQVDPNAPFCANCGNRLSAAPVQPAQPVYQVPAAPSKFGLSLKAFFPKCFVSPIEAAENASDIFPFIGLIFAGSYAVIAFLLFLIHIPLGDVSVAVSVRALFGLFAFLIILASIAARAGIGYAFGRKNNPGVSFLNLLSRHAMLKLYPFCAFFMMFLMGLFSMGMALVFLICGELLWTILSIVLLDKYLGGLSDTKRTWSVVLATAADWLASALCLLIFYTAVLNSLSRYLRYFF